MRKTVQKCHYNLLQ